MLCGPEMGLRVVGVGKAAVQKLVEDADAPELDGRIGVGEKLTDQWEVVSRGDDAQQLDRVAPAFRIRFGAVHLQAAGPGSLGPQQRQDRTRVFGGRATFHVPVHRPTHRLITQQSGDGLPGDAVTAGFRTSADTVGQCLPVDRFAWSRPTRGRGGEVEPAGAVEGVLGVPAKPPVGSSERS